MANKTLGIRWQWKRGSLQLTQIKASPRGTKYFGKTEQLKRDWPDKESESAAILAAIEKLQAP